MNRSAQITLLIGLGLLLATQLWARSVVVEVSDADLEIPLEGAELRLASGAVFTAGVDGRINLILPDGTGAVVVLTYPGYQRKRLEIKAADTKVAAAMHLEGALESKELVIEGHPPGQATAQAGVSTGLRDRELRSTATIGLVEDVMTSIKALPGVGYTGGWNTLPSIRGGEPQELTAVFDGFYVDNPWHWGGAYSIFNPNLVESATLSHGIFSARYGNATSGVLEVVGKTPPADYARYDFGYTTSDVQGDLSLPFGGKGGLLLGGRVTYWDPFVALAKVLVPDVAGNIAIAPYIRDSYLKYSWRPVADLEIFGNAFFGSDGVGTDFRSGNYHSRFEWNNLIGFTTLGARLNPSTSLLSQLVLGVGLNSEILKANAEGTSTRTYSTSFISSYDTVFDTTLDGKILGLTSYVVPGLARDLTQTNNAYSIQAKWDNDLKPADWLTLSFGADEIIRLWKTWQSRAGYFEVDNAYLNPIDGKRYTQIGSGSSSLTNDGNQAFATGAYLSTKWQTNDGALGLELGVRLDTLFLQGQNLSLKSSPVVNPRGLLTLVPIQRVGLTDAFTITLGSGLFSRPPEEIENFDPSYNIKDYEFQPNRTWSSVAGLEWKLGGEYRISLEGYYKQTFNRFYANTVLSGYNPVIKPHFDGVAEIWGVDFMAQKLESRYVDGWLTYSYNWARYRNPTTDTGSNGTSGQNGGDWFWPSFHRFHTVNFILNVKPTPGFSFMTRVAFASGRPQPTVVGIQQYPVVYQDGTTTIVEKYKRVTQYSNTARTDFSLPVDFKFSWNWYDPDAHTRSEFYIGIENAFVNLYTPKKPKEIDPYTGVERNNSDQADFNIGIPMFSIGFKWSY